jgi:hypothetical protein
MTVWSLNDAKNVGEDLLQHVGVVQVQVVPIRGLLTAVVPARHRSIIIDLSFRYET